MRAVRKMGNHISMPDRIEGGLRPLGQARKKSLPNKPLISIVTVVFNGKKYLADTIQSVLSQSYGNKEYIIIDGGSTDGTLDIIRAYNDSIDYWVSEPDRGIADAFNKGIAHASGEIVGLINADDELLTGAIEKMSFFFLEYPDVQVMHGDVLLYNGKKIIKRIKPAKRWWLPWRFVLFNHPATFVKRNVYQKHGNFRERYQIAMDVEMYLRWVKAGLKIVYFPEPFVQMKAGGISGSDAFKGYREARDAFLEKGYSRFLIYTQYFSKLMLHLVCRKILKKI